MAKVTKTINPLHFEDLEPHRFEDLVRQLIYDYRYWSDLEATGRKGSDEGFDVRGREIILKDKEEEEETGKANEDALNLERLWLIQCKREKEITPKKMSGYLSEIKQDEKNPLHGLLFIASCDFSKETRDVFRKWCIENGISEFHIWGRSEIEDMLFQPKNDHLLFAYFNFSLQVRKSTIRTNLRSRLATKKQAIRIFKDQNDEFGFTVSTNEILLRDPEAEEYPDKTKIQDFDKHPKWVVCEYAGRYHSGLLFMIRKHFAYLDEDKVHWDYEKRVRENQMIDNPWARKKIAV